MWLNHTCLAPLQVEAEASTDSRPLPGFTPRKGAGLPFLGKSVTYPPASQAGAAACASSRLCVQALSVSCGMLIV